MKIFPLLVIALTGSSIVHASTPVPAKIYRNIQIVELVCEKPGHISHEESDAGTVTIRTPDKNLHQLHLIVSRWSNELADAKELCRDLKNARKKSGVDMTFRENNRLQGPDENEKGQQILGVGRIYGLETANEDE